MSKKLHMYVDDGNCDTVIAYGPEDASAVMVEHIGMSLGDLEDVEWTRRDDGELVAFYSDGVFDDDDIPPGRLCTVTPERALWAWRVTATVKEWIEHRGRGLFSTTEY